ncbi:DNA replication/repair protein RecF [Gottschalkiaceae bacterium SANA]|nr:DNA replication/repair protein RecF [Gottschalkiaceae bacterium SANA]
MRIRKIHLIHYRNYRLLRCELGNTINIFYGENAQGKTNLLEAIHYLSYGKSFRKAKDRDLIAFDQPESYIGLELERGNGHHLLEAKLVKDGSKKVRIDRLPVDRIKELNELLYVIAFIPEDLRLVKGSPKDRREFIDRELSKLKPVYAKKMQQYERVLKQRNMLLKMVSYDPDKEKILSVYTLQLIGLGSQIIKTRQEFLAQWEGYAKDLHGKISDHLEELAMEYESGVHGQSLESIQEDFEKRLEDMKAEERTKGTSLIGPHRDDLIFLINGKDARIYASQGQQRTVALSVKLAEIHLVEEIFNEKPVLLLDDVLSELDAKRRQFLIETFRSFQTIITTADDTVMKSISHLNPTVFHIQSGSVIREESI